MRLDAPPGVAVAAPGVLQPDGSRRLERGRDYSFAAGRLRSVGATIAGVDVTVWGVRGPRPAGLDRVLRIVRKRLPRLTALFGPYGWPDLQIVITDDASMEHTGLIMTPPQDFVITHELAHEWWYALVGNDQAEAPWLDEAFASYAEEAAGAQRFPWCRPARPQDRDRHARRRVVPRARLPGLRARLRRGRLPARRAAQAHGPRPVRRRAARATPTPTATAGRRRASSAPHMDAASPVPLGDLWRRYRVG